MSLNDVMRIVTVALVLGDVVFGVLNIRQAYKLMRLRERIKELEEQNKKEVER